jgi:mersacidin/lichenicidin family type 2 lantibiotic
LKGEKIMSNIDIIRAWKDEDYRNSLTEDQRSQLPENPAGMLELSNSEMESLKGGMMNNPSAACTRVPYACNGDSKTRSAFDCVGPGQTHVFNAGGCIG